MGPHWVACMALVLAVAGCAGPAAPESASTSSSVAPAPEPSADASTGSVAGTVVDDEQSPIAGAGVSLVDVRDTKSDEAGKFTFNEIPPGKLTVIVSKLGYNTVGKKVDVAAGQVATVHFVLTPLAIVEAYHESFSKSGVLTGQWTVNHVQNVVNNSVLDSLLCSPCSWVVEFQPKIVDGVTDLTFKPSPSAPVLNQVVIIAYDKALNPGEVYNAVMAHQFGPNGQSYHWTEAQVKNLKDVKKARLELKGPDPDNPGIVFQQRVDLWQTFGFGGPLPENFTMLPP